VSAIDTTEFRALLEQERERIKNAIDHLHAENAGNMEDEIGGRGTDNHMGDMASVTLDRELDQGLEEGAQQTLEQIENALARIDAGTYGTCERCGKAIPEERLRARPWATLCIDDQRLADRG
jgi:RNA polymerase-binding protein DksA